MMNYKLKNISYSKVVINVFLIATCIAYLVPLWSVIMISLTDEKLLYTNGFSLFPEKLSTIAYEMIFRSPQKVIQAYWITILTTVIGSLGGLLVNAMVGYTLSRNSFKLKRFFTLFFFFTMLFQGGMVPGYIYTTQVLHLQDNLLVLILPGMVNVFIILILRTYFKKLPEELIESAKLDGAGEMIIFITIIWPISIPVLATVTLMMVLTYWNSWFGALLFINKSTMYPLQMLLREIMQNVELTKSNLMQGLPPEMLIGREVPTESMKMAMCIVAAGPMLIIFPFFQKYFVQGLTIGSIKG